MPTYQGAEFLDECLASIAAQELDGVEVIVCDDGSSDGSVDIARAWSDRIPRLRVLENPERLGPAANMNRCMAEARGGWIKPVFQDDLIEPGCLTAMRAARRRGVAMVVCARTYLYEEGVPTWRREACEHLLDQALDHRFGGGHLRGSLVAEVAAQMAGERNPQLNFLGEPVAMLFHRGTALRLGGYDTGYVQLWDYELALRVAMRRGIVIVDRPLARFRVHEGSQTARNLSGSTFRADILDRLRLGVAYASSRRYRPVRDAAERAHPNVELTALALGTANAGRRLIEELPPDEQEAAAAELEQVAAPLPLVLEWGSEAERISSEAEVWLFCIVSHKPDPQFLPLRERPTVLPPRWERMVLRARRMLRVDQWWAHMLGPIVALAFAQLGWRQVPPGAGTVRVLALLASAICLAGYGYLVNDASDVEADRLAGKRNLVGKLPVPARIGVIAVFAALGALPWLLIHLSGPAKLALAGIYLVPLLYSPRPVRLKERHLLGPIADASNAFVLPALFTVALFAPMGDATGPGWLMTAGALAWSIPFGLRAILIHQVVDADHDRASGTRTLVTRIGEARAVRAMRTVLFPVELVGLALLAATVATWAWWAVAVAVLWAVGFNAARLTGAIPRGLATTTVDRGWFLYWYQIWPALLLAVALTIQEPWYAGLLVLELVVFAPRVAGGVRVLRREVTREVNRRDVARRSAGS